MLCLSDLVSEPKGLLSFIQEYENQPIVTLEKSVEPLVSIVPDIEQMIWTVKQTCKNPQDNLSLDESGSIMLYTLAWIPSEQSFYFILNSTLRNQNRQALQPWFLYLRLIMSALAKLPSLPYRTIYRGIQMDMSQDFIKDKIFIWWSFSSCTSTIDTIKRFLGNDGPRTVINIECDSAKDISRHSFYQRENEILLYPARQFKVISSFNAGNQFHIIQIKEIQPLSSLPQITPTKPVTNNSCLNQRLKDLINTYENHSEIKLSRQQLTDEDMHTIVQEAIINKQCRKIWLDNNKITSTSMSIIANTLNTNTTLNELILSYNNIGDTGVLFLTKILSHHNSSLQKLVLASIGMTDNGTEYLVEMLKINSTLDSLILNKNKINNRGIEALINTLIHHNSTLKYIDLAWNKSLTDSNIDSLIELLKQNRSLTSLNISGCNLSEKSKDKLRQIAQTEDSFTLFI